ncbi:MAG: hypothetical protein ACK5BV_01315, partial [Bacteroidota bacterium]
MRLFRITAMLVFVGITSLTRAQQLNFQGVARNASGSTINNTAIKVRLSIKDGSATGPIQYSETRSVTTSAYGSFKVLIGSSGAVGVTGALSTVTWASGSKFLQVEVDPNNGN